VSNPLTVPLTEVRTALLDYCCRNNWAGYDPYDALNSRLLSSTPLATSRSARILLTQLLKRLPVNLRPLLGIAKEQNAKAMALFLMAALKSPDPRPGNQELIDHVAGRIEALRSPGIDDWCWGYSFPWQTRTVLVPRSAPNLVCTTFVAGALLDLYEASGNDKYLEMSVSAGRYIVRDLYWKDGTAAGFSYPVPGLRTTVHNANLLAAALLARIHVHRPDGRLIDAALSAAGYAISKQRDDGSWPYGESPTQGWIDNFHTGYNLCAIHSLFRSTHLPELTPALVRGFRFYRQHFVSEDGIARYFHNRTHPIDIHSVAQTILTLVTLREAANDNLSVARQTLDWAVAHMWDSRGYFCYRYGIAGRVRVSYMRWSQAWMLLALTSFEEATRLAQADEVVLQ
jgi:hypothetical protein